MGWKISAYLSLSKSSNQDHGLAIATGTAEHL